MDYRSAYEKLSQAVFTYDKTHHEAYVRLMLVLREIEQNLGKLAEPSAGQAPRTEAKWRA